MVDFILVIKGHNSCPFVFIGIFRFHVCMCVEPYVHIYKCVYMWFGKTMMANMIYIRKIYVLWFGNPWVLQMCDFCILILGSGLVAKSCLTLVTPLTVAHQGLLSMGFSKKAYCIGFPFPSLGDFPSLGIEPVSPALQVAFLPLSHQGSPIWSLTVY